MYVIFKNSNIANNASACPGLKINHNFPSKAKENPQPTTNAYEELCLLITSQTASAHQNKKVRKHHHTLLTSSAHAKYRIANQKGNNIEPPLRHAIRFRRTQRSKSVFLQFQASLSIRESSVETLQPSRYLIPSRVEKNRRRKRWSRRRSTLASCTHQLIVNKQYDNNYVIHSVIAIEKTEVQ